MIFRTAFVAAAFSVIGTAVFATGSSVPIVWAADIPMQSCDGVPCIDVQFGHALAGRAIIDTGDVASLVDVSDENGAGFDGKTKAGSYDLARPDVTVGTIVLKSVPTIGYGMQDDIAKGEMPHSRFLLAYPAFKNRILQLDFVHHRVRISDVLTEAANCDGACASLSFPTFGKAGPPIVVSDGFAVNGHPITVQIDSVYTGNLLIYSASIAKLGLSSAAQTTTVEEFAYTDGGVKMRKAPARWIAFAGQTLARNAALYFPTPGVHQPDGLFDGTVGLALLGDKIVTLDFHDKTISIANG
jgi:hypothetical protein